MDDRKWIQQLFLHEIPPFLLYEFGGLYIFSSDKIGNGFDQAERSADKKNSTIRLDIHHFIYRWIFVQRNTVRQQITFLYRRRFLLSYWEPHIDGLIEIEQFKCRQQYAEILWFISFLSSLKNAFNQNFSHSKRLLIFWCFISQRVASDHFVWLQRLRYCQPLRDWQLSFSGLW